MELKTLRSLLLPAELPTPLESKADSSVSARPPARRNELHNPLPDAHSRYFTMPYFSERLLNPDFISTTVSPDARREMLEYLQGSQLDPASTPPALPAFHGTRKTVPPQQAPSSASHASPSQFISLLTSFNGLKSQILQDLENHLPKLLTLNMSRREAVVEYLERLAGITTTHSAYAAHSARGQSSGQLPGHLPTQPSTSTSDATAALRRWIEGPRSPAQNAALHAYFEEIALITLGQAVLLKAWSDRGIRNWAEADLKDLNYVIHNALKTKIPLDRETWQVARQNIYSWYKPGNQIQQSMWSNLESWRIASEGPGYLVSLFSLARQARPENAEPQGYDSRFFKSVWDNMRCFGFDPEGTPGAFRRGWAAFSPTLRDGAMVRNAPVAINWVGTEGSPFQLMVAELMQLWWGPAAPPLWAIGNGLEAHARDQLSLNLTSPKPSLLSRIVELEAFDVAFLLEEKATRGQSRSQQATKFWEQTDALPYFKKLRASGTTLGDLQACVTISKLRPGGLMWWAREEPLSPNDGTEMLNFLLERGKLICEWDFAGLEHTLPSPVPLFPKHLYLWMREPRVEERLTHRPLRIGLQGALRSHVEVPLVLEDALLAAQGDNTVQPRGQWKIHSQPSPAPQKDWAEHWPNPASQTTLRTLDKIREVSLPIANAVTVRHTPKGNPERNGGWSVHLSLKGLWIQAGAGAEGRRLVVQPLPHAGKEAQGSGFMLLLPDESWIAPLRNYLESPPVRQWLEHHAERRGDRWILNEQLVKWIPIPKALLQALGLSDAAAGPEGARENLQPQFARPLPGEWEKLASEIIYQPRLAFDALKKLPRSESGNEIRAEFFVRASRALEHLQTGQNAFLAMVSPAGRIRWSKLLDVLPKSEHTVITLHPKVRVSGHLPPHMAIGRIERVKSPAPGILLATEAGFNLHLGSDSGLILDMLWDQLDDMNSPTWSELLGYLKLPRRLELAETAANDVLRSHGEQSQKIQELIELLTACSIL